jgi:hypothetical protein
LISTAMPVPRAAFRITRRGYHLRRPNASIGDQHLEATSKLKRSLFRD